jgi:hypothetical protein
VDFVHDPFTRFEGARGWRACDSQSIQPDENHYVECAKAEQIVRDLLVRVKEVNAHDEFTHFVEEVRAFGSYITASPDVADIDLAISFVQKPPPPGKDLIEWYFERADQSGRTLSSINDRLDYSELEVRRMVKGRNQYVSIHAMRELAKLKIDSRRLYVSPDRPRYHPRSA